MPRQNPNFGKMNKTLHIMCKRCGRHAFHVRHRVCAACGYGRSSKIRQYTWQTKNTLGKRRKKK